MKSLFCFIFLAVVMSGCCFNSSPPRTEYFTINTSSEHARYNYHVEVEPFKIDELYGTKMVFFKEPNSIFFDSFNKWAQVPDKMLSSYFCSYFNDPALPGVKGEHIPICLTATILKLECNLTQKECLFSLKVTVSNSSNAKLYFVETFTERQQMDKVTASSFALSVSNAVKVVAQKVEVKIDEIYKSGGK